MSADDAKAIRWWHSIDLGNGWSDGIKTRAIVEAESHVVFQKGVRGKTVLDVGAWDGFFSFEAERLGASRVLATDHIAWSGWGWGTKDGFDHAHRVRQSGIESRDIDLPDISPESVGVFDVVLFLGVLYHLKDPLAGLEHIAKVAGEMLIVETVTALNDFSFPVARFYRGDELNADVTNYWAPNTACLEAMLYEVGFNEIEIVASPSWPPYGPGLPVTGRHIALARR